MKRYCNVTFVEEGSISSDDGTPIKLLRCSRCQGAFYRGKEEQRAHWKVHKKVCRPPSEDDEAQVNNMDMDEAASELMALLKSRDFRAGPMWTLLLQRIHHLFRTSNDRSDYFDEELVSNIQIGRGMILSSARQLAFASNSDMELLWAIPNFANFLLSVDLISNVMLEKKQEGVDLTNKELFPYDFDPNSHVDPGCANLMVLFLMAGVLYRTASVGDLSKWSYRKTAYAKAAFCKMVTLWIDPYARASMVLRRNQVSSIRQEWMPLTVMNVIDQSPPHSHHIAPGLSVNDAVRTVVEEGFVFSHLRLGEMIGCILDSYGFDEEAWMNFDAEDRATCALMVVEKFLIKERGMHGVNQAAELAMALTGWATRHGDNERFKDAPLRLKVVKLASRNRTPTAERSFPRKMSPPDYFGLCYDKMVETQMPLVDAFVEGVRANSKGEFQSEIPQELLFNIAEFAAEPFSRESRDGIELQYLTSIW